MAAMATVSMFLSLRDSTLNVNSDGGWGALRPEKWLGHVCLTMQMEVTVATECPLAKQGGATPSFPESPHFLSSELS